MCDFNKVFVQVQPSDHCMTNRMWISDVDSDGDRD